MVILGIILFSIAIALWQLVPPNVVPAKASLTEFSAVRAMPALKVISQAPHPIGSAAHTALQEYLMTQLQAKGDCPPPWGSDACTRTPRLHNCAKAIDRNYLAFTDWENSSWQELEQRG